jgi:MFS family permease
MQNIQNYTIQEERMVAQTKLYYLLFSGLTMFGTAIHFSVYSTFLLAHGLDLFQVSLVNVAFYVTLFVFEIPTGAFADVFGRKASYVVSCMLWGVGSFVYASANSFWGFAFAEAIVAIGATFASGAFEAWAVDRLRHHGYAGELSELFARKQYMTQGIAIVAGLLGAALSQQYLSMPWWIGGAVLTLTGFLAALFLK